MAPIETAAWSFIFMTDPLPNCRSICPSAASSACSRSTLSLLAQPFRVPRTARRSGAAGKVNSGVGRTEVSQVGQRRPQPRTLPEAEHRHVRQPGPPLPPVDPQLLEPAEQVVGEGRRTSAVVVAGRASRRSASRGSARTSSRGGSAPRAASRSASRDRRRARPAGRAPRKASVTCRFSGGTARAGELHGAATRRARRATSSGSRRAQKRRSRSFGHRR